MRGNHGVQASAGVACQAQVDRDARFYGQQQETQDQKQRRDFPFVLHYSPESNGLAEGFVHTLKRDTVNVHELRSAETVLAQRGSWILLLGLLQFFRPRPQV